MEWKLAAVVWALALSLAAQGTIPYTIQAAAGISRQLGDGAPATGALLFAPRAVTANGSGGFYIADTGNGRLRQVSAAGGIETAAQIEFPAGVAIAPSGDVYVADSANNRVRKISANGAIGVVAGNGMAGYTGDGGPATQAQLSFPLGVALDRFGNLYIADTDNSVIRRVTPDGRISTVAGRGIVGFGGDGNPATGALLSYPRGVAVDAPGNIYIADTLNNRIRMVASDGTISTLAGQSRAGYGGDGGPAEQATLNQPSAVDVDAAGNLYIADTGNDAVREMRVDGTIRTIAGTGSPGFTGDNGPAVEAELDAPQGVSVDAGGNVFIADTENNRVRRVTGPGLIQTVAGSDPSAGDGAAAVSARLFQPSGVAFDAAGNFYISETGSHRVRKVSAQGVISTVAGTGVAGYSGDGGGAAAAQLNSPNGLAVDRSGNLYIADTGNNVVRMVSTAGTISTIAGTGVIGNSGDGGPATLAALFNPNAVAFDPAGNLYIADSANHRVRKIGPDGIIRDFAGDGQRGLPGYGGDGGAATDALLDYPRSLAIDDAGNVYIADFFNHRIRKVAFGTNVITTFAGTGTGGGAGDGGPANAAQLNLPAGIALDKNRNLYIADSLNERVRMVASNGSIATIAGSGVLGDSGDGGPATAAELSSPRDVTVDAQGVVYFSDQDNHRVRKLTQSVTRIGEVVNAASEQAGAVAPGELITLYGSGLGPAAGISGQPAAVLFDGIAAPVLYTAPGQINAIVPYEVAGKASTGIQLETQGQASGLYYVAVAGAAPGIFSLNSSGSGQGAIVNQDGSLNSASNPAARGSVILLFATGEGQTDPPGVTGRIAAGVLPKPVLGVTVLIGGEAAEILYAGAAPGDASTLQVNAQIPDDISTGPAVSVGLAVGSYSAQSGITVAVK